MCLASWRCAPPLSGSARKTIADSQSSAGRNRLGVAGVADVAGPAPSLPSDPVPLEQEPEVIDL
eukprot:7042512-Pyramimonas_sp.AAC.1